MVILSYILIAILSGIFAVVLRPNPLSRTWTRQWAMMDSHAEPSGFSIGEDGTAYVEVHLIARDLHGNALFDAKASHVFQFEDGLIRRFDIRK